MFSLQFHVDYADTDAMGVAHHANYFRWLERARVEWLRGMGISYKEMEAEGYLLPLREARMQYKKPLKFDDNPTIEIRVNRIRMAGVDIDYRIVLNGELMGTAFTSHVVCSKDPGGSETYWSPVRLPEKWRTIWLAQIEKNP